MSDASDSVEAAIWRYFDRQLTQKELEDLDRRLAENVAQRELFVQCALLHQRLGDHWSDESSAKRKEDLGRMQAEPSRVNGLKGLRRFGLAMAASLALIAIVWLAVGSRPATASAELQRVIACQKASVDRTYRIAVEESFPIPSKQREEAWRPPKPSMDGAILHVRGTNRFVLIRTTDAGLPFLTGCDGNQSWVVKPDGPIRTSGDPSRFSRDLPGHEYAMPFIQIESTLKQLQEAFTIESLPAELDGAASDGVGGRVSRLLVAIKKPGRRGPRRVEVTYDAASGELMQVRFIDLPYGPKRLTLRMTSMEQTELPVDFFEHRHHHAADRRIETE
ncbi:MAG: hypothetical protein ACK5ZC_14040 [Pirellulaceae bacterium]|jgi:hypothetical protein